MTDNLLGLAIVGAYIVICMCVGFLIGAVTG